MISLKSLSSPSRRAVVASAGALFSWAYMPKFAQAAQGRDPRLIVVILRGALDGLAAVGPIGDPDYAGLHGEIALSLSGTHPALPLDGFFALNPGMPGFADLFKAGQAAIVHATATAYRDRSHFDGQDVLESGYSAPGRTESGWLNRALAALPKGEKVNVGARGLAVGTTTPLVLRGEAPVVGWAPAALPAADDDLTGRLLDLYKHRDPLLATPLAEGLDTEKAAGLNGMQPRGNMASVAGMRQAAEGAAKLIAADDGPRVAALAFDGWDTHAAEGGPTGRLAMLLSGLDGAFAEFKDGLGPHWRDTAIVAITEFGRTARVNGTIGTDHGTGTVAFLAGGAIKGGRVIADWPGLKPAQLYQNRDLAATTDLRGLLKGLLADQLGLGETVLGTEVFPESMAIKPMHGLIA